MVKTFKNDTITFSLRDGIFMPFMYKGKQIVVHNASWSFREKIWVDDALILNRSNCAMASHHDFDVDGETMHLEFGYRNRMTELFLTATVNGEVVHSLAEQLYDNKPWYLRALSIAGFFALGMAFGYFVVSLLV